MRPFNIVRKFATRLTKAENKRLDMGEMPNNMPTDLFDNFLRSLKQEDFICYPCEKDYNNLKKLIAELNEVKPVNISLNYGSDQSIKNIFSIFEQDEAEVVFNNPAFPMYGVYSETFNLKTRLVGYNNYKCELEDLLASLSKNTKLVALANPNSPYGDLKSKDEIINLCDLLHSRGIYLLLDEAYIDFGGESCVSLVGQNEDVFSNLFITKTFSKAWGAAGTRCGYSISSESNTKLLEKLRPSFPLTGASIKYLQFLLQNPDIKNNFVSMIAKEKSLIKKMSLKNITIQTGSVSWINCKCKNNATVRDILEQKGIAAKYIDNQYVRIGLFKGCSKLLEKIDLALEQ